jgi:predicted Zn-dependent protease
MWEMLEMALATLHAILRVNPGDPIVLNYGSDVGMRFGERADALERAAENYFCHKPNQDLVV